MIGDLVFAPLLPQGLAFALIALALLVGGFALLRRARGGLLRLLGLAFLILAMLDPRLLQQDTQPEKDVALVVVDRSPSQQTGDRAQVTEQTLKTLQDIAAEDPALDLRVVEADADADHGTRMIGPMQRALAEIPDERFAGAVLITDGQVHDAPLEGATLVKGAGRPIHAFLTGSPEERDRRLVLEDTPAFGIVGERVGVRVRLDLGGTVGAKVPVILQVDGQEIAKVTMRDGEARVFRVPITHAGATAVELSAEAAPDELSLANNRAVTLVNGVRDRLKVLLVSGEPHRGERAWRDLLKSDPAVEMIHFTILRPPFKDDFTPLQELALIAFPTRQLFQDHLQDFDLIIFDRYVVQGVLSTDYFRNIANYVDAGGALLLAHGPGFAGPGSLARTHLVEAMVAKPTGLIREAPFKPTLTDLGRRHPVTRTIGGAEARWGRWFRVLESQVDGGETLMNGESGLPLLVLGRKGEGRVAQVLSDHLWLWQKGFEGGGPHLELMRRLVHWLMREPDLEEEALTAEIAGGRLTVARRSLKSAARTVTVEGPDGAVQEVPLAEVGEGLAKATLPAELPGLYRLSDGEKSVFAVAGTPNPLEFSDLRSSDRALAPLVKGSGGGVFWLQDGLPDLRRIRAGGTGQGRGWFGLVRNEAVSVTGITETPLLPWPLFLTLGLGLMAAAWWREGR